MRRTTPLVLGRFTPPFLGLGLLALTGLVGCGGASTSDAPATQPPAKLSYTPPSSLGYRLVADPSSTPTTLVLNLVGPVGATARGVHLNVYSDGAKVAWAAPAGSATLAKPGTAFDLGTGLPLLKNTIIDQELQVSLYQKGSTSAATLSDQPMFSVALALKPGAAQGPVTLKVRPGCQVMDAAGNTSGIQVAAGSVVVN